MNKNTFELETDKIHIGFIIIIIFCALRPITLINLKIGFLGFNILEIFAITISYVLLFFVFTNLKYLNIDLISFLIILFCFYCILSLLWGSQIRVLSQIVLPFVIYFAISMFVTTKERNDLLISILIIAYIIPLIGSFYQIIQGTTISHVESITGIERHSGLFAGIRTLANAMYYFSVLYFLKSIIFRIEKRTIQYCIVFMLVVSLYCAFKSYTRSILLGLLIFWAIGLIGINKKYFLLFFIAVLALGFFYQADLQEIFFKKEKFDIQTASSGRSFIWKHNIELFKTYNVYEKVLGRGLGVGSKSVIGEDWEIWSSHNDYLHLLMHLGGIGLFLYLLLHFAIIKKVIDGNIEKKIKYFYLGFIFSIMFINFSSGIITYQLPTAQIFWMVIGFLNTFESNHFSVSGGGPQKMDNVLSYELDHK